VNPSHRIVMVVGPSGVGKSTACNAISGNFPNCLFVEMDQLTAEWAARIGLVEVGANVQLVRDKLSDDQLFFALGMQAVGELAGRDQERHVVVDVGAGFQDARSAVNLHKLFPTIAVITTPDVAYRRIVESRGDTRSFHGYSAAEFCSRRRSVYEHAAWRIDTSGLSPGETASRMGDILALILSGGEPITSQST
jgi:adenylate kinase